jgi:hypothetical protein
LKSERTAVVRWGLVALVGMFVILVLGPKPRVSHAAQVGPSINVPQTLRTTSPVAAPPAKPVNAVTTPEAPSAGRADEHLNRFRAPLAGAVLTFPPSFSSPDGVYDLILHLNGNTALVEESYASSGLNAVIVVLNLGVGSGVYEDRFADPAAFRLILMRAQDLMVARGLKNARLGRVGLSGWSAGYGGIRRILEDPDNFARVNAILLYDAIHVGYDPYTKRVKPGQFEPFRRFAQNAAEGKALLSITHSEIETYGYYSTRTTTNLLLEAVGVARTATDQAQPLPNLPAMYHVVPDADMKPLRPLSEAHHGGLHVRGYAGDGPAAHMLHLVQMSTTALPDLVAYWKH